MQNQILLKHPKNWGLDEDVVIKLADKALADKGFTKDTELSLTFVGQERAKALNIKYRNKNYIPQVLGFPMTQSADADGVVRLGDIVICTKKVKYEAEFQNKTIEEILSEWLAHGVDNLLM